jgi:hypothetical protein
MIVFTGNIKSNSLQHFLTDEYKLISISDFSNNLRYDIEPYNMVRATLLNTNNISWIFAKYNTTIFLNNAPYAKAQITLFCHCLTHVKLGFCPKFKAK